MTKRNNKGVFIIAGIMLAIMIIAFIVSKFFYQLLLIRGESMSPTYHNLQLTILDKRVDEYVTGDVVAFKCDGVEHLLIKRIVACPGDRVCITDGELHVNGEVPAEYIDRVFNYAGLLKDEIHLEEGQYIVIGDNIEKSRDSRYEEVGIVLQENLLGRVIW